MKKYKKNKHERILAQKRRIKKKAKLFHGYYEKYDFKTGEYLGTYKKFSKSEYGGCKYYKRYVNKIVRRCEDVPNGKAYRKICFLWNLID